MEPNNITDWCEQCKNDVKLLFDVMDQEILLLDSTIFESNEKRETHVNSFRNGWLQRLIDKLQTQLNAVGCLHDLLQNLISDFDKIISQIDDNLRVNYEINADKMAQTDANALNKFDEIYNLLTILDDYANSFVQHLLKMHSHGWHENCEYMNTYIRSVLDHIDINLERAIKRSFVFTKQSPLLVLNNNTPVNRNHSPVQIIQRSPQKCNSMFSVDIKCYCCKFFNIKMSLANSPVCISDSRMYTEEDAQKILNGASSSGIQENGTFNCIFEDFAPFEEHLTTFPWTARLKDIKVQRAVRKTGTPVHDTRYSIVLTIQSRLQQLQIPMNGRNLSIDFNIKLASLPFCVLVNPSQINPIQEDPTKSKSALGYTFWYRICNIGPLNTDTQLRVPYGKFHIRLNELFKMVTGCNRDLQESDKNYFAWRLFGDQYDYDSCLNKMVDCDQQIFFPWLNSIFDLIVKQKYQNFWNTKVILFISKVWAEWILNLEAVKEPTILIWFADTCKAGMIMSIHFPGEFRVVHLCLKTYLERNLPLNEIFNLICLRYSYMKEIKYIVQDATNYSLTPIQEIFPMDTNDNNRIARAPSKCSHQSATWDAPKIEDIEFHNFLERRAHQNMDAFSG